MEEECRNCHYYREKQCKRYPPKQQHYGLTDDETVQSWIYGWPYLDGDEWCGEFKPRA